MFKKTILDFNHSGTLNKLVLDYLEKDQALKSFYNFFPDQDGFKELINTKPYQDLDRAKLSATLEAQGRSVANTHEQTNANIALLRQKQTFTITTGHQLCLFTGPLYFIYKIFSAITLAETLKKEFPAFDFVPVYWMASEDHDFEEVASFHANGKTITWDSRQTGAVGNFKTGELEKIIPALREALGISENANYLLRLFEEAYLKQNNLANATRYLVNALFGQYGLVTLDGNDRDFKAQAAGIFRQDLFENSIYGLVNESAEELEKLGYTVQVNPRPVNCFYLEGDLRTRIEKNGELYSLVGTERTLTRSELEHIIDTTPEKISPNVVLRPVYQQVILPNLAYIGGPGELAYWLEFKNMFSKLNVLFPILMPRDFISIADKRTQQKTEKLQFGIKDFFKSGQELVKEHLVKINAVFALEEEIKKINSTYEEILARVKPIDETLVRHIAAANKKTANLLDTITSKTNRALKKKADTSIRQVEDVKQQLFPNGTPQERYENFATFYLQYGPDFFTAIKNNTEPFLLAHKILLEA